ncbi:hypothetical protein GE09DRAFT_503095 [Coniochaeta sp. 2T2.1]|nr:hypothetical protein GE09DRAFT_503095 [Coniochaeta sp. 2T2.1]
MWRWSTATTRNTTQKKPLKWKKVTHQSDWWKQVMCEVIDGAKSLPECPVERDRPDDSASLWARGGPVEQDWRGIKTTKRKRAAVRDAGAKRRRVPRRHHKRRRRTSLRTRHGRMRRTRRTTNMLRKVAVVVMTRLTRRMRDWRIWCLSITRGRYGTLGCDEAQRTRGAYTQQLLPSIASVRPSVINWGWMGGGMQRRSKSGMQASSAVQCLMYMDTRTRVYIPLLVNVLVQSLPASPTLVN